MDGWMDGWMINRHRQMQMNADDNQMDKDEQTDDRLKSYPNDINLFDRVDFFRELEEYC